MKIVRSARTVYRATGAPKNTGRGRVVLLALLALLVLAAAGVVLWSLTHKTSKPATVGQKSSSTAEQAKEKEQEQPKSPQFDKASTQNTLSKWTASHNGTYSVVVADGHGNTLATHQSDKVFFAASLYKLYVAYVGYQKIDDGTYDLGESYLGGWSRGKCLDEMIRSSHSPCAEKLWVELGKENLNTKLKNYGLTDTSMTALTTSARDIAKILARIEQGKNLSKESRKAMLSSMKAQIYRSAMPKGFVPAVVYDKVGFRELVEYHDVGMVELPGGERVIVAMLTQNVGTQNIAGLASALFKVLTK